LLGIYISDHPISSYLSYLPGHRSPLGNLHDLQDSAPVTVCGIVMSARKILTKKNQMMAFLAIEDETGASEAIVFPKIFAEKEKILEEGKPFMIEGKISRKESRLDSSIIEVKIIVDTC